MSSALDSDAQTIGRGGKKDLPDLGAGLPDRAARLLDREAARGDAFVRARRRRGADHLHAGDIDIEFVGGDLRQRGDDALPDLHLARRDRHLSIAGEISPMTTVSGSPTRLTGNFGGAEGAAGHGARHLVRRAQHRPHHAVMRAAAAEVAVERGAHVRARQVSDFASAAPPRSSGCRKRNSRIAAPVRR